MIRSLSHSELAMVSTCEARHAFAYTGRLTDGEVLKRRAIAAHLSNGRAWGAAVAAWHSYPAEPTLLTHPRLASLAAHQALRASFAADVAEQAEHSVFVPRARQIEQELWLSEILEHYMTTAGRMTGLHRLEEQFDVPIPSRTGVRSSSRYRFGGFIDGWLDDPSNVVEFKLRDSLSDPVLVQNDRQIRRYAWAHQRKTGMAVIGAIVDERLAAAPKPPKMVHATRKADRHVEGPDGWYTVSHDKRQFCLAEDYLRLCEEIGAKPHSETVEAFTKRLWQFVHRVMFRRGELEEAGEELVSIAKHVRDLDSGERYPVRNTQPQICRGCHFREACQSPHDRSLLDTLFVRKPPKRDRAALEDGNGEPPTTVPVLPPADRFGFDTPEEAQWLKQL